MVTVAKPSMTGLIAALEGEEPETNILRVMLRISAKRIGGEIVAFPLASAGTPWSPV
jgi:hypothetical protein